MLPPDYVQRVSMPAGATEDRGRLLLLVLEGGQAFLLRARGALERGDFAAFVVDMTRTQDVLLELSQTLDHAGGSEVAASFGRLHELMVGRLALANAEQGLARIDEVLSAYAPIVDAYRAAVHAAAGA